MVKEQVKTLQTNKDQVNYTSDTLPEYKSAKKSRQEINRGYYQKNKEKHRERYQKQKSQPPKPTSTYNYSHYSQASDYKVLISLKQYTQLNKEKMKLLTNFRQVLKSCSEGIHDIIQAMKVREEADKLVNDYWTTAKNELKNRSRSWNSLTEEQQDRLIKYWGQQKARWENALSHDLEKLEERGKIFEKEIKELIEISLFHEERGMIKCPCWSCEKVKQEERELLGNEIAGSTNEVAGSTIKEPRKKQAKEEKEKCPECGKMVKELDEENGICKKCVSQYE